MPSILNIVTANYFELVISIKHKNKKPLFGFLEVILPLVAKWGVDSGNKDNFYDPHSKCIIIIP